MKQNPTVTSFLIANIDRVMSVLTFILGVIIYYIRFGGLESVPESAGMVMAMFVANILASFIWDGTILQFICFFGIVNELTKVDHWITTGLTLLIAISVMVLVCGVWVSVFTWNNFEEVVSRRMKYINSRTSLYEEKWKYVIGRFFATAAAVIFSVCTIVYVCIA